MNNSRESEIVSFYNKESDTYSKKRYEGITLSYTQYFFKNRLSIVLKILEKLLYNQKDLNLLDIGCADGVIIRAISEKFPAQFKTFVGVDVSPSMVEVAKRYTGDSKISFYEKKNTSIVDASNLPNFDICLALGYLSKDIYENELLFVKKYVKPKGIYICTLPAKNSSHAYFKIRNQPYRTNYVSYHEYKRILMEDFEILDSQPNSIFIPKIWAVPFIGRILQPVANAIFAKIFPGLYHEMIYVCRLK